MNAPRYPSLTWPWVGLVLCLALLGQEYLFLAVGPNAPLTAYRITMMAVGVTSLALIVGLIVANTFQPGVGMNVDPATIDEEERERRGIDRLPATQEEALHALAADELLLDALGPTLADSYLAVRRSEWAAYSEGDEAFEQQGHFSKY